MAAQAFAATSIWDALEAWRGTLAAWQQSILDAAIASGHLTDQELDQAYVKFSEAYGLRPPTAVTGQSTHVPRQRPSGALEGPLVLKMVDGLAGINALPTGAQLTFSPTLTVIYGRNGAGKSGFARLLANACFSRSRQEILADIYAESTPPPPSARFHIEIGGSARDPLSFGAGADLAALKRISVFDSAVARQHIGQSVAVEFKPAGFDVFPEMARAYGALGSQLDAEIARRTKENTFPNSFIGEDTAISTTVRSLGAPTDLAPLRLIAVYGEAEKARFGELETQITALRSKSSAELLKGLREARGDVEALRQELVTLKPSFSPEAARTRNQLITSAKTLSASAAALGSDQFKRPFFTVVGAPEWERFAQSAHELAHRESADYPREGDHCLLCEQPLTVAARDHILAVFQFVEGDARKRASAAIAAARAEKDRLVRLELRSFSTTSRVRAHVLRIAPDVEHLVDEMFLALQRERTSAVTALEALDGTCQPTDVDGAVAQLEALRDRIAADIARLEGESVEEAIASLDQERRTLRHREVLSQLWSQIEGYVGDAKWCVKARTAKAALNTRAITDKEKDLFNQIVGQGYRDRLAQECTKLECVLPIEMQTVGQRGQTLRSLAMRGGHKLEVILSEGEQKAVALADFLTEIGLNPSSAGIVFDDPVTSQDHQRKERIAQRLVEEAQQRQVIVFTHDLVFLNQLSVAADAASVEMEGHWIDRTNDGRPGHVALGDIPITLKAYENASRAEAFLAKAKAATGSAREEAIRQGMGALRTTLEETVVRKLFKDIVPRWTDQVRVTALKRVNWDNAKADEICALYEELSRHIEGHSHTEESRGAPVDLAGFEAKIAQVQQLIRWARPDRPNGA